MHRISQALDEALELLYGQPEDEIRGVHSLLNLLLTNNDPKEVLSYIIQNQQLIAALARLLGEDSPRPIDLTFNIGKIFYSLSVNKEYHQVLSSHRVGALALGVLELECKRAVDRVVESTREDRQSPSDITPNIPATCSEYIFSAKQKRVMFICLGMLDNLADDVTVLRKMVKKSLVDIVTRCTQDESSEFMLVIISILKKASIFEETALKLSKVGGKMISQLCHHLSTENKARRDIVTLFFNLSFHEGCLALISSMGIHSRLVAFTKKSTRSADTLHLIYHLSSREENRRQFHDAGLSQCLIHYLERIQRDNEISAVFIGLLVNMTLQPLCCEYLMKNGITDSVFCIIQKSHLDETTLQILLKVLRNLCQWTKILQSRHAKALHLQNGGPLLGFVNDPEPYMNSKPYWENHFWDKHVDFVMKCTLQCEESIDLFVEWLGILNNFTHDDLPAGMQWFDILHENKRLTEIFQRFLQSSRDDDIRLELIIWLGELCSSRECSYWLATTDIFNIVHTLFLGLHDSEMRLQIIHIFEKCLFFETTRLLVLGGDGILDGLLDCLKEEDSSLRLAAERCLVLIDECDRDENGMPGEMSVSIQQRRYEALMLKR